MDFMSSKINWKREDQKTFDYILLFTCDFSDHITKVILINFDTTKQYIECNYIHHFSQQSKQNQK